MEVLKFQEHIRTKVDSISSSTQATRLESLESTVTCPIPFIFIYNWPPKPKSLSLKHIQNPALCLHFVRCYLSSGSHDHLPELMLNSHLFQLILTTKAIFLIINLILFFNPFYFTPFQNSFSQIQLKKCFYNSLSTPFIIYIFIKKNFGRYKMSEGFVNSNPS